MTAGPAGKLGHLARTPGCGVPGAALRRGLLSTEVAPAAREFPYLERRRIRVFLGSGSGTPKLSYCKERRGPLGTDRVNPPPPRPPTLAGARQA